MSELKIRSHVGRDILQSAQLFRTPEAAVWEYVVNSLQYLDPGTVADVTVTLDVSNRKITISDNSAGMDLEVLSHFFTMHGENRERRMGVPGRGKFGTGKAAAFGIGTELAVSTTRNGKRQTVVVDRTAIDAADGDAVPVRFMEKDVDAAGEPNGTTIVISGITTKIAREPVISLIERHLAAFQGSPVVRVNGHVCEIRRPVAAIKQEFRPTERIAELVGDIKLTICASSVPLEASHRGVQITVGPDNLVAVETAGVDTKEYGQYLFGHVDCAELDNPKYDPVAPYGNNRDLTLNKAHPVALAITTFIGASLEQVRAELVAEGRKQKAEADAKRLRQTTSKIEEILNADLKQFRDRLEGMGNVRRHTPLEADGGGPEEDPNNRVTDPGGEEIGSPDGGSADVGTPPPDGPGPTPPPPPVPGPTPEPSFDGSVAAHPDVDGADTVSSAGAGQRRLRGGLTVDFDHFGADYDRYHWDQEARKITINLDHPTVKAAKALPDDEATFRRLCYEIAFTGYAVALADLQFERDPALLGNDATFEIRAALRRVWAGAAVLYEG